MSDAQTVLNQPISQRSPLTPEPVSPILKWAGGKTRLMPELISRLPESWDGYYEPFMGGGALFFRMGPPKARVSDLNYELVNVYTVTRDRVNALIAALKGLEYDRDTYYGMRALDPETLDPVARAAAGGPAARRYGVAASGAGRGSLARPRWRVREQRVRARGCLPALTVVAPLINSALDRVEARAS